MRKLLFFVPILLVWFFLSGCTKNLLGDITPPPSALAPEPQPATVEPTQESRPFVAPDPTNGAAVYTEKCLPCHGASGLGDGPEAANLPAPPHSIGNRDVALAITPVNWFQVVSQGNMQKFMPPFEGSLTERQCWDVVAYLYTLPMSREQFLSGKKVYVEQCQSCHGERGRGDGIKISQLSSPAPDWGDPTRMAKISTAELYLGISAGIEPDMPGFSNMLNDQELWAVMDYVRMLSFSPYDPPISGIPPASNDSETRQPTSTPPSSITVTNETTPFAVNATKTVDALAAQVTIERTSDTSTLIAQRLHLILDFPSPGVIQVAEVFIIVNPGNKMIVPESSDKPLLQFELPPGFTNLNIQDESIGDRFILTDQGFGDTQLIQPQATEQIVFAFDLSYDHNVNLDIRLPVAVQQVIVMLPSGGVSLQSSQLTGAGQRDVQGTNLDLYVGSDFKQAELLKMEISGKSQTLNEVSRNDSSTNLAIGLGVFGVALLGVGFWFYRSQSTTQPHPGSIKENPVLPFQNREDVLDAIVVLDDLYRGGKLSKEAYIYQRTDLKARLKTMGKS
jgi:mono/diheme cytochrome c family protein